MQFKHLVGFLLFAALAACGDHDFSGSWIGDVERTTVATGETLAQSELWKINGDIDNAQRTRTSEVCNLEVQRDDFYPELVLGSTCMIEGRSLILVGGSMNYAGNTEAHPELIWAATPDGQHEVIEHGIITQQSSG